MPIYDYFCPNCGHQEEHIHGMFEEVKFDCPTCAIKLKIKIGAVEHTIGTGGTRNRSYRERYGNPKHRDSLPTASESADAKATEAAKAIGQKQYDPSNPYG